MSEQERWTARRDRLAWGLAAYVTGVMYAPMLHELARDLRWPFYLVVGVPVVIVAACVGIVEGWKAR